MMELTGTLDAFPLRELLELMQESSMCGMLEIQGRRGTGMIGAKDGLICHAEYAGKIGLPALWLLFEETDAAFAVKADRNTDVRQTMLGDAAMLSEEGQERAKIWKPIRMRIPDLAMIPVTQPMTSGNISLDPIDQTVFAAIDGARSVEAIAEPTFLELVDVCRSLVRLIDAGAVRLLAPAQARGASPVAVRAEEPVSRPSAPAPAAAAQGASGFPGPSPQASAEQPAAQGAAGLFRRPMGAEPVAPAPTTGLLGRLAQQRR